MYTKTVLTNIDDRRISSYLVPKDVRVNMGYPPSCLGENTENADWEDVVGLGFYIITSIDPTELYEVVICNSSLEIIFKSSTNNSSERRERTEQPSEDLNKRIQEVIRGKVVVGFEMG